MTWIKTVPLHEASEELLNAIGSQRGLYPSEYELPVPQLSNFQIDGPAIVLAHSLIPSALHHAFAAFGSLMSPDLPLKRRHHEMIAATVSALNSCFY